MPLTRVHKIAAVSCVCVALSGKAVTGIYRWCRPSSYISNGCAPLFLHCQSQTQKQFHLLQLVLRGLYQLLYRGLQLRCRHPKQKILPPFRFTVNLYTKIPLAKPQAINSYWVYQPLRVLYLVIKRHCFHTIRQRVHKCTDGALRLGFALK